MAEEPKILNYATPSRSTRYITILVLLGLPWLSVVILGLFGGNRPHIAEIPGLCVLAIPNAAIVGLPQILCYLLWRFLDISASAFRGGVVAGHMVLIAFTVVFLVYPTEDDSMAWIYYFVACIPLVSLGLGVGSLMKGKFKGVETEHSPPL
jgi:hypothetical protein